jgi:hypothetical protein
VKLADGGGRIVINPADLRRGSNRLRHLSGELKLAGNRLRAAPVPETAPPADGVPTAVHALGARIDTLVQPLADSATELDRRALWAEIADQLIPGATLSGSQLAEFMAGLRDGTMIRYAEPWQAELAGEWLGRTFRDGYKVPAQVMRLADLLQANAVYDDVHGMFMAGFIHEFGAQRLVDMPRVIQAMEWTQALSAPLYLRDHDVDTELGFKLGMDGYELDRDPVGLLGSFSMALAVATYSGRLSRETERAVAYDEDTWAVSQLLYQGKFGGTFLRDCFEHIAVPAIQREAAASMIGGPDPTAYFAIGGRDGHGPTIPIDQKLLVLQALDRNPEAAMVTLSTPLEHPVYIASPWSDGQTRNPVAVLYAARWDDDGKLFAHIYTHATDYAQNNAATLGTSVEGNRITLQLADRIIENYRGDLHPVVAAFVDDLVRHDHIHSLIDAAGSAGDQTDGDDTAGFLDVSSHRIYLNADEMQKLFVNLTHDSDADARLTSEIGKQQAAYIAGQVATNPDASGYWAHKIGSFNQLILNAHDIGREIDFQHQSELQKVGLTAVTTAAHVLTEGHPLGVLVGPLGELVGLGLEPDHGAVVDANFQDKLQTDGAVKALIATGFYEYGGDRFGGHGLPTPEVAQLLGPDGHLRGYGGLAGPLRVEFDDWVERSATAEHRLDEALTTADRGMREHAR